MKLLRLKVLIITFQIISISSAVGQSPTYYLNPNKKLTQYNSQSWTTKNGLPTSSLLGTCQTSDGYLWIASYDGLIRFDGDEFTVFNKSNTEVFESNTIRKLAEDKNGVLWMSTQGNGLISFEKGVFTRYGKEKGINHLYRALYIDEENKIWSASPDKGWFYFQNGEFTFLQHSSSLCNIEVRSIEKAENGDMWFGTFGKGLYRYSNGEFTQFTEQNGLLNNWVYSLFYDSKGVLWIGTSNGLCYFDDNEFKNFNEIKDITINDILCDNAGVKDTIQQRNSVEFAFTIQTPFPFSVLTHILKGGAVTETAPTEKFGLGKIDNAQFWQVWAPLVYDESVGDYVGIHLHKAKYVEPFTIDMPFGDSWKFTGIRIRAYADTTKPSDQQFATFIRADASVIV